MSNLREAWLGTGATQAALYRELARQQGSMAITKSAFGRALRGETEPEARTKKQIEKAILELKRQAFVERYSQSKATESY